MKKLIKRLLVINVTLMLLLSLCLVVKAWTPPKLKNEYVEPEVEFRSVWVCTVSNMDISKQIGTDEAAINNWKEKYLTILENCVNNGMNAVIFQVSPCNDAFYPSKYRPWSEFLAGFGVDPGWDPVEWMIEVTHEAGLEYHAWFNPYRTSVGALSKSITEADQATGSHYIYDYNEEEIYDYKQSYFGNLKKICTANNTLVDNPIFYTGSELDHAVVYGTEGKFVLNPAAESTIKNMENTIKEFITNYDVDGIHFDDYFYPDDKSYKGSNTEYKKYTFSCEPDIDYNDYLKYKSSGGDLSIFNWRRENVNMLIKGLSDIIRESNITDDYKCAFGISPAARWAPSTEVCPTDSHRGAEGGMIENCNNYYSYSDLFADTRKWAVEGWLDYILPQNYTYLGSTPIGIPNGTYPTITKWWSDTLKDSTCKLYIGTALYQINTWSGANNAVTDEFYYQQRYNQDKGYEVDGYVMFRYDSMLDSLGAIAMRKLVEKNWTKAALTPIYEGYVYDSVDSAANITEIKLNLDSSYTVSFDKVDDAKAYGILEDGECIARVLAGKSSITFNKTEGKTYQLVTYGFDNQMHADKKTVNFDDVKVNQKPVITIKSTIEKEYLVSSVIDLKFTITDTDSENVTYSVYAYVDERKYDIKVNQPVAEGEITVSYECFAVKCNDCYLVVEANDGYGSVEEKTTTFNVVKELTPVTPPHEHNFVEGSCECGETDPNYVPPKKGKCGKKSIDAVIACLSITAVLSFILRKKE